MTKLIQFDLHGEELITYNTFTISNDNPEFDYNFASCHLGVYNENIKFDSLKKLTNECTKVNVRGSQESVPVLITVCVFEITADAMLTSEGILCSHGNST